MAEITFAYVAAPADRDHVVIRKSAAGTYQWQWALFAAGESPQHFMSPHVATLDAAKEPARAWAEAHGIDVVHMLPLPWFRH